MGYVFSLRWTVREAEWCPAKSQSGLQQANFGVESQAQQVLHSADLDEGRKDNVKRGLEAYVQANRYAKLSKQRIRLRTQDRPAKWSTKPNSTDRQNIHITPTLINMETRFLHSVILAQAAETGQVARTIEAPVPRFLGQNTSCHTGFVVPLRCSFRLPGPVKPSPGRFKARHLALSVHQQPLLVVAGVSAGIRIGRAARTGRRFGRALRSQDGRGFSIGLKGTFPAISCAHVVQILGAVCVCLRPFSTECRSKPG